MGVRIKPCFGCPIPKTKDAECLALREKMRERVHGLGLRSAVFDCPVILSRCAPGTRVVIEQKYMVEGGGHYWEGPEQCVARADVPATILDSTAPGFTAVVDRDAFEAIVEEALETSFRDPMKARFRRRMPFSRIKQFIPEPRRELCANGNVRDPEGKCGGNGLCQCAEFQTLIGTDT